MSLFGTTSQEPNPLIERRQDAIVLVLGVGLYVAVGLYEILNYPIKQVALSRALLWAFGFSVIPSLIILLSYFLTSMLRWRSLGWVIFAGVYFLVLASFYPGFANFIYRF